MEKRVIKNCGICKYFERHYIKRERDEKIRYQRTCFGHCNGPIGKRYHSRLVIVGQKGCVHWGKLEKGGQ